MAIESIHKADFMNGMVHAGSIVMEKGNIKAKEIFVFSISFFYVF